MTKLSTNKKFILLILLGLLVRFFGAYFYYGHATDMACFESWSNMMFTGGPQNFYTSDAFTDYPPLYMYVLWFVGMIKNLIPLGQTALGMLLKTPAIAADILTAVLLCKIAPKHKTAVFAFWLFNPAVILNSSIWGQVDSVFTLAVFAALIFLMQKRYTLAYFIFALSVMIKPQALFYTPLFLFSVAEDCIYPKFDKTRLFKHLGTGAAAIAFALVLCIPFGLKNVFLQYIGTLSSYNYCSVNAYNFWTALGLNWAEVIPIFSILSTLTIIGTILASGVLFFKLKGEHKYFLISGFICLFVFTFAVKMHERYIFPAMLMLLAAYAFSDDKRIRNCTVFLVLLQLINTSWVLFSDNTLTLVGQAIARIVGALCVILAVYFAFSVFKPLNPEKQHTNIAECRKILKLDVIIMAALTVVYSAIALTNLGDMKAPSSGVTLENTVKTFELSDNDGISGFKIFLGRKHLHENNTLSIELFSKGESVYKTVLTSGSVYAWEEYEFTVSSADTLLLETNGKVIVLEMAFLDTDGNIISGNGAIFDEQNLVPDRKTNLNSTYFDEIYHARTAYELNEGEDIYEWTHPPLGKIIIGIGIKLFGMNPFGWRIAGTVFGIFMVPVIYIFAKKLFGNTAAATFAAVLFTFDFMHFVQTRIATIDVYVTFFIMLQYLFMLLWLQSEDFKKGLLPLALAGVSFGLSAASKWTGIYAGAGLAVIFFAKLGYDIYKKQTENILKLILFCVGAFVAVPIAIYLLSYIPFVKAEGGGLMTIWQNQVDMLSYHGGIDATHPYSSSWYEWAAIVRPIWYYSGNSGEGISAFGNPLVWWIGIPSLIYTAYYAVKYKDKLAIFLGIGYMAQLLPWVFVTRITFIYHYFPCVPFSVLMTAFAFDKLFPKKAMLGYAIAVVIIFALFYPVLSGNYIDPEFVGKVLRWSKNWVLISG